MVKAATDPKDETPEAAATARPGRRRRLAGALAVAAIVVAAVAWPLARPSGTPPAAAEAVAAIDAGRLDEAADRLESWLKARPDDPSAYFQMARLALKGGNDRPCALALDRAAALGHPAAAVARLRALLAFRAGRPAEAEALLAGLSDRTAIAPEIEEARARHYLRTYELGRAREALNRWLRAKPDDPTPYLLFTQADRRDPSGADAAVEHYRQALGRDPKLADARLGLAQVLAELQRHDEAAAEYRAYLELRPDDLDALAGAARNATARDDLDGAAVLLDRCLARSPDHVEALKERARIALRRLDHEAALPWLDRAARADPFDAEAAYNRGLALARVGRPDEARVELARAQELRDDHQALMDLRQALDRDPNNLDVRSEIARWMIDHGQGAEGVRWAETALAIDPKHAAAHRLLADHFERQGEHGRANFHRLHAGSKAGAP